MLREPTIEDRIRRYEGLVHKTASLKVHQVEEDFDDLCSIFRIKVWQALESFDPERSRLTEERYVFMCITNLVKDLTDRRRTDTRGREISLDVLAHHDEGRDRFDHVALRVDPEQVFAEIEDDGAFLPNTLSERERTVIAYLYAGFNQTEITKVLDLTKREMEKAIKSVREKMADWNPSASVGVSDRPVRELDAV